MTRKQFCANRGLAYKESNVNSRMLAASRSQLTLTAATSRGSLLRAAAFAVVFLGGSAALYAQGTAPGSAAAGKLGVISVRQAIASTAEGKQAGAELQSQFAPRQNELEGLNKQINDLRQRIETGRGKISDEEQARLTRQGEGMARQLQRKQDE